MRSPKLHFYLLLLLHILAIVLVRYYVTQDGPSHTYNAYIIKGLLSNEEGILTEAHRLNLNAEPNLTGHYLMALLMFVMTPVWAEKLLLVIYLCLFSFGFLNLLKRLSPAPYLYALLIFPLAFNLLFFYGFFNFILGSALSIWFFSFFLKWKDSLQLNRMTGLACLATLVYFSHVLPFLYCGLFAGLLVITTNLKRRRDIIKGLWRVLLIFLPGMLLTILYLNSQTGSGHVYDNYSFGKRLFDLVVSMNPVPALGYSEGSYLYALLLAVYALSFYACFRLFRKEKTGAFTAFGILIIFSFFLALFIPDGLSGGSVTVPRIALYYLLFLLALLSFGVPAKWSSIVVYAYVFVSVGLLAFRYQVMIHIASAVTSFKEIGSKMEDGTSFFTIATDMMNSMPDGYSPHASVSFTYHIDNYLALSEGSLNLRNYEIHPDPERNYFPTQWKPGFETGALISVPAGNRLTELIDFDRYNQNAKGPIRYIITYAEPSGDYHNILKKFVPENYVFKDSTGDGFIRLYELPDGNQGTWR